MWDFIDVDNVKMRGIGIALSVILTIIEFIIAHRRKHSLSKNNEKKII